ncbi:hypothetical protein, partial [Amycolatopsis pithecellobii]
MARHPHVPTPDVPTPHHTNTPSPQTPHHTGESGAPSSGGGYRFQPDQLGTMEGRIDATRSRVDAAGQRVASANFGAQSMGVVGSTMTGTLNTALDGAKQQVAKASAAVEGARTQTRTAREALQGTEQASADTLSKFKSEMDGKTTPSAGSPTRPASAAAPATGG